MDHPSYSLPTKRDRILVVDDSPDNCFLVQTILQGEGYEVEIATSGKMALEAIDRFPPDLVLLDVMMPEMNGYEVTQRIRNNPKLAFMPILLVTAHDQASVAFGLDSGADDFIRKPVEFDELLARVRSLLRLKHSVDERDRIARQREDFVSRLTHDLRTPLVAADRMLTLLQEGAMGELTPQVQEAVSIMSRSNQNLLTMVNMLLEVYRYEAGRKRLTFAPVNLAELAQEVLQELSPLAVSKGLTLNFEDQTKGNQTVVVQGDQLELYRVLTNLVGNGIKFTDSGFVTVRLSPSTLVRQDNQTTPAVMVAVQDTGPGIQPEEKAGLFESFVQGSHKRGGSGLGLQLSRRIVQAHNGQIEVKSEVDQGSTFIVQLPLRS